VKQNAASSISSELYDRCVVDQDMPAVEAAPHGWTCGGPSLMSVASDTITGRSRRSRYLSGIMFIGVTSLKKYLRNNPQMKEEAKNNFFLRSSLWSQAYAQIKLSCLQDTT
jgi:hypothetical protein